MFIDFLNKDEQFMFLSLANELVKVDGELSDSEIKKIENISNKISNGLTSSSSKNLDLSKIDNIETKRIIIIELIGICFIDGNYCDKEKKYITQLSKQLNIVNELPILESWVVNQVELTKKGIEIIKNQ